MSFPSFSLDSWKDETKIHLKPSLLTLDYNNLFLWSSLAFIQTTSSVYFRYRDIGSWGPSQHLAHKYTFKGHPETSDLIPYTGDNQGSGGDVSERQRGKEENTHILFPSLPTLNTFPFLLSFSTSIPFHSLAMGDVKLPYLPPSVSPFLYL